jgi:hypothetical protein
VQTTQKRLVCFERRERLQHAESTGFSCASGDKDRRNKVGYIVAETVPARAGENYQEIFLMDYQQILATLIQCLKMLQYTTNLKIREEEWLLNVTVANQC